jgi:hypothetical protein
MLGGLLAQALMKGRHNNLRHSVALKMLHIIFSGEVHHRLHSKIIDQKILEMQSSILTKVLLEQLIQGYYHHQ